MAGDRKKAGKKKKTAPRKKTPAKKTPVKKQPAGKPPAIEWSRDELLRRLQEGVGDRPELEYAVAGATAMAAHGYKRETQDVDVFVLERDLNRFMVALRQAGLEIFAIAEPSHFAAKLPGDPEPERRIDVLVPWSEPELSAVEHAVHVGDSPLRFVRPDLLALAKFYAWDDSGDLRHAADIQAMYRRGMFDADVVRDMLVSIDPERTPALDELIGTFAAGNRSRGKGRRLPRTNGERD